MASEIDMEQLEEVHVELDVGNLCINNITALKAPIASNFSESKLKNLASTGVRKLLNEIFKLPSEYHEHVPVAKLPEPTTIIPREKHVPKAKPMTKWEKFANAKGITKQKKDKLVWDEPSKEWKPRFGYRSANNKSDWLVEVPDNADGNVDYFGKIKEEKKERVSKNEYQRLRNIASSQKMKVTNLESVDRATKDQLSRSLAAAKTATASVGRFTDKLPKERQPKNRMKKRQFKSNFGSIKEEKENNLKILQQLDKKKPKLDVQEAVQRYMTKPLKEPKSDDKRSASEKKKKAKKNKFIKNTYRSKKRGGFKNPVK